MKINANRDDLLKPLLLAGNVIERRQTLPILANVLIATQPGSLKITATDLEVEITTTAVVENSDEMEFTVPAKKLIDICKAIPEGSSLSLEVSENKAILRSGRGRFTMGILPAKDYPSIDPTASTEQLQIPAGILKRLIDKTSFAMAHQDVRYYLNGLMLEIHSGRIRAVATDGHRLALCDGDYTVNEAIDMQVILPRKAVGELGKILHDHDDLVNIEVSSNHIRIHVGSTSFTSKLIDGKFPDYERVMPKGETNQVTGDKEALKQALARTSILSNEKYRGIRFRLENNMLHLQAHNPEQDEAEEELEIDYSGPELSIGFNVSYLLDVLGVLDSENAVISLVDANSSALITPADTSECRYIIMPMRL